MAMKTTLCTLLCEVPVSTVQSLCRIAYLTFVQSHSYQVLTKVKEKVEAKAKEKIKNEGMWRVLLHNDEIHTFDYVTHSIVKVVKQLSRKKAHQITVQTHSAGQASVIIVWKALAETYCLGLQRQGLTASIAPDSGFKKNDDNGGGGPDTDGGS